MKLLQFFSLLLVAIIGANAFYTPDITSLVKRKGGGGGKGGSSGGSSGEYSSLYLQAARSSVSGSFLPVTDSLLSAISVRNI